MNLFTIFYFFFVYTIELGSMLLINKYFYSFLDNNWDNFKNISPLHKKWYVVSNLTKSIIFSFYSYWSCWRYVCRLDFLGRYDSCLGFP